MFRQELFYSLGLYITLTIIISAVENNPNISGYYKIASVTDDSFLTGSSLTNTSSTEHERRDDAEAFQLWSVVQQVNGTKYFVVSAYERFRNTVPLIPEGDGLWQRYNFEPVGRNLWTIYANGTRKCLTNRGIGVRVGLQQNCGNTTSQLWILHNHLNTVSADYSGVFYIQSPLNGKYITATNHSLQRTVENHKIRKDHSREQEWKFSKRLEYGDCYEIRLAENRTQLIPTGNSSLQDDSVERLTLVFEFESVGQARWKIKQLNSDNCLGFVDRVSTGQIELQSSPCENSNNKQIWFLIKLFKPVNANEGSRGCKVLVYSANRNEL